MRISHKRFFTGVAVVIGAILIGALFFPSFAAPRIRSPKREIYNNLRQIVICGEQYLSESGASEVSFAEISKLAYFPKTLPSLDEADYASIVVSRGRRSYIVHSSKYGDIDFQLGEDGKKWPNLEGCVRPERSGAVNTTIVEQAPASPEVPQGRPD